MFSLQLLSLDVRQSQISPRSTTVVAQVSDGCQRTTTQRRYCARKLDRSPPSRAPDLLLRRRRPADTKTTRKAHQVLPALRPPQVQLRAITAVERCVHAKGMRPVATSCASMLLQVRLECLDYLARQDFRDFRAWQGPQEFLAFLGPLARVETVVCNCLVIFLSTS